MKPDELMVAVWYSWNGFYKPEYDSMLPESIYELYVDRKYHLINSRKPTKDKNWERLLKDKEMVEFTSQHKNMAIGFFRDKQAKRRIYL